ncbi:thiamine pyrophosphate-binding protein [Dactylosporangium sp. CA-233914]|uniref:thiamine pyrophosphate-binding protein n=1 Tax=Dactylosporangium sp. CA-233914 TaxID=3239934 RepID=UPI003D93557E
MVEVVEAQGVPYVFGVPGAKIDGLRLVVCRHEQNAAFMAAAVGRLTGTPGVVLVASGPGTALLTATTEQDQVVALCGALRRAHQSMDATALLSAVTR